ncbi:MAG: NAD(P)/FAD-dependent oxidoreductase, partial [Clostridia bacterium]
MEIIKKQVIIIGGGAAGLVAAIFCAKNGADTIILEKNNRIGKKILVTGNGRCNLSNINLNINKYNKSEETGKIFNQFSVEDTLNFFKSIGLMTYADSEGRIYPSTDYANSVLDVLRIKCENLNVKV